MSTTTTTNLALVKPTQGTNEPASIFTSHNPNMDTLDAHHHGAGNAPAIKRVQSGTFAARPAAGNAGHVYVATDTGAMYFDTGAAWVQLFSALGTAYQIPRVNSGATALEYVSGGAQLISNTDLNGLTTVTLSSIPQTFNALLLLVFGRTNLAGQTNENVSLRFNGDTAGNYRTQQDFSANATAGAAAGAAATSIAPVASMAANNATAGAAGSGLVVVPYYANPTLHKAALTLFGNTPDATVANFYAGQVAGRWENVAAITSITLFVSGTWQDGSRALLLGL